MTIIHFIIKAFDIFIAKRVGEIDKRRLVKRQIDHVPIKIEMYFLQVLWKWCEGRQAKAKE